MRLGILVLLGAGLLIGCQSDPTQAVPNELVMGVKPGTRLSPKLLLADDGTLFLHPTIWKDSEFGECEFRTAADGMYRCLPNVLTQPYALFLDPSCVQEVFIHDNSIACSPMGLFALVQGDTDTCNDTPFRALKVGKAVDAVGIFRRVGDSCQTLFSQPQPSVTIYLLGDEVAAGEFVSAWR